MYFYSLMTNILVRFNDQWKVKNKQNKLHDKKLISVIIITFVIFVPPPNPAIK